MPKRRPKKPRSEWPFLVRLMLQRGTGIVGTSVARWSASEGSEGRPFIRFALETPDGMIYRVFLYPQQEKYLPKPEVIEEILEGLASDLKEKREMAIAKKKKGDEYKAMLAAREEARTK